MRREAYIAGWWRPLWLWLVLLIVGGMLAGAGLVAVWVVLRG
jgi:hypothetical protein